MSPQSTLTYNPPKAKTFISVIEQQWSNEK